MLVSLMSVSSVKLVESEVSVEPRLKLSSGKVVSPSSLNASMKPRLSSGMGAGAVDASSGRVVCPLLLSEGMGSSPRSER